MACLLRLAGRDVEPDARELCLAQAVAGLPLVADRGGSPLLQLVAAAVVAAGHVQDAGVRLRLVCKLFQVVADRDAAAAAEAVAASNGAAHSHWGADESGGGFESASVLRRLFCDPYVAGTIADESPDNLYREDILLAGVTAARRLVQRDPSGSWVGSALVVAECCAGCLGWCCGGWGGAAAVAGQGEVRVLGQKLYLELAGTWSRTATRDLCPFACHLKASPFASWTTKAGSARCSTGQSPRATSTTAW
eukprot:SAG22_NODE_807_length_7081_cov_2.460756_9_plen_250_part_00